MEFRLKDIEAIYHTALEKEAGPKRSEYLNSACGENTTLRGKIEALLKASGEIGDFLETPLVDAEFNIGNTQLAESTGTVIGRYKLLEKIGEGGMAVVYMAEQEQPIRRKVALKIIKLGMDTKSVIARFEAERQALAMMDHPNIAKVLDAGATETGRPYFVMELATGVSITAYCDKNSLNTEDRLALFIQVCNAVQHAHQKGIIHRDIKPSNVMVTQHEGTPIPKVIDFGIAKATNQRLTEKTLFTRYAHIIGTPAYMSPEQAEMSDLDVDTRSDIYSLGVLLYELLTGTTPFSEEELRKAGYLEMQRVIREQEPPKPSTKLSMLGGTLTDIAKYRSSTPDLLTKAVRGDLDWIVMKSLEKDRALRYETANGLSMDIRRHLESEPVLARGPNTVYRLQKFLCRNRAATVAGIAMITVIVVVGFILYMWKQDRVQLKEAESFRHINILSKAREFYAKGQHAEALEQIRPILGSRDVGSEAQLLYAGILVEGRQPNEAVTMLERLLDDRPEIAGAAHSLLARILWESPSTDADQPAKVEDHRRKAESLLPETAEAYFLRAMTAITIKEKLDLLDEALRLNPGHYESRRLRAFTYYASRRYKDMERDALVMTALQPRDPLGYSLAAIAWHQLGQYEKAVEDCNIAIRLTVEEEPQYVELNARRCDALMYMGQYERVVAEARQCLKLVPDALTIKFRVFCALTALGDYEDATSLFRQVTNSDFEALDKFKDWSMKYVFDRLEARLEWHPSDQPPAGRAFRSMLDAQDSYRLLSSKAKRLIVDGFTPCYSPDGKKVAFSTGFHGYSGVAVLDMETGRTDLLIVPGKDPSWSPDGRHIAFVRDCPILSLSNFTAAERRYQHRLLVDEEVWIMRSDGTEPRRLAHGGWPSWSQDSKRVYYQSRKEKTLYSVDIEDRDARPVSVFACSDNFPSLSPDESHVAYLENGSVKVKDVASQTLVAEWPALPTMWGGAVWSPAGSELALGGGNTDKEEIGLWIYSLGTAEPKLALSGQIVSVSWSTDRTQLLLSTGSPCYEIWVADLDPAVSTTGSLGAGQTIQEHYGGRLALYTQRIDADPNNAENYYLRAQCYDALGDRASASADMRWWSAAASEGLALESSCGPSYDRQYIVNMPLDCQLVFSAERPTNTISMMSVAFGQKGRCNLKLFKIPMFVTSVLGFCLLSGLDSPPAHADVAFGTPTNLGPAINSSMNDLGPPGISEDGLFFLLARYLPDWSGVPDQWMAQRETINDPWNDAVYFGPFDDPTSIIKRTDDAVGGYIRGAGTADGLEVYWQGESPGSSDLWVIKRDTVDADWQQPQNLGPTVNSSSGDYAPTVSADGLALYFGSNRPGGYGNWDIYVTTRATRSDSWGEPVNLGPAVNSPSWEYQPSLSADGLVLFFASGRPGGLGPDDIYMARRASPSEPWGQAVNLGPTVNTSADDWAPGLSADGSTLYFTSTRPGGYGAADLWKVSIEPLVDFDGDGDVDCTELCVMTEYWGTTDSLCDIAPPPFGDGVVDVQDLVLLSQHLTSAAADPNAAGDPSL